MKIKRFFAKDMRAALTEVKEILGPDAVIMSNKKVTGGIEIVAAVDDEDLAPVPGRRHLTEDSVNISSHARQQAIPLDGKAQAESLQDRKSTRLNSSHVRISYAVFCLKKKTKKK